MQPLSVNEFTTMSWSFDEDAHNYAAAGYQGIGVMREKIESYGIARGIQLIREEHLKVTEVCSTGGFADGKENSMMQSIQDAYKAIELAHELEAGALIIVAGTNTSLSYDQSFDLLRKGLEEILPYAERHGVRLALEPMHPIFKPKYSFVVTLNESLQVIELIDSPYLGVWLDTFHVWWDNDILKQIHRAKNRIIGVHLNDFKPESESIYNWSVPGEGIIPLPQILHAIESSGWRGMYSIEVFSADVPPADYLGLLSRCRMGFDRIWT